MTKSFDTFTKKKKPLLRNEVTEMSFHLLWFYFNIFIIFFLNFMLEREKERVSRGGAEGS